MYAPEHADDVAADLLSPGCCGTALTSRCRMATGRCAGRRERASPVEPADQIAARDVTACFAAPTAYRAMATAGNGALLRGLRRPVSAGEYLPAPTWQARVRPR